MFIKIKLYTSDGRDGKGGFVHEDKMPAFAPPAEVIIWGQRVFKLHGKVYYAADVENPKVEFLEYIEAFTYFLPSNERKD